MAPRHTIFGLVYPVVAWVGDHMGTAELRRDVVGQTSGKVIEIGAGNGRNFRHYPSDVDILATEPHPRLCRQARRAAARAPASIAVLQASVESLPVDDESIDTVVSTLVLCSVPVQASALAEVRRILRPGGRLLVLEHVRSADPALARRQDSAERMQMFLAGGCHPNRDTTAAIRAAGFDLEGITPVELPGPPTVRPGICGWARKSA